MKENDYGFLGAPTMYRMMLEFMAQEGTEYDGMVEETQAVFGLEDWNLRSVYAEGLTLEKMRQRGEIAWIETYGEEKRANLYFDEDGMADERYDRQAVVEHELAHLVIAPYAPAETGRGFSEIQTIHLGRACQMLRQTPEELTIDDPNCLQEVIDRARKLTRLDINEWRVIVENDGGYDLEGRHFPIFAESQFHDNHTGLGVLSANQIILHVDPKAKTYLPDAVAEALWRVVLNPYGKPTLDNIQETRLQKIMKIMKGYGWGVEK